jgi:hypothetical protein
MQAKIILFHICTAYVLFLTTKIGIAGILEYGIGYLWKFLCVVSPLLLGIQFHVIYLKIKSALNEKTIWTEAVLFLFFLTVIVLITGY